MNADLVEAIPFRTDREGGFIFGKAADMPPALLINPAAPPEALAAAIHARVDQLVHFVHEWAALTGEHGPATCLLQTVQEIEMLVDALEADLRGAT